MDQNFYYLGYDTQKINGTNFLCIYLVNMTTHTIHKVFKKYTDDFKDGLDDLELFCNFNSNVRFVIKRDGRLALDILL